MIYARCLLLLMSTKLYNHCFEFVISCFKFCFGICFSSDFDDVFGAWFSDRKSSWWSLNTYSVDRMLRIVRIFFLYMLYETIFVCDSEVIDLWLVRRHIVSCHIVKWGKFFGFFEDKSESEEWNLRISIISKEDVCARFTCDESSFSDDLFTKCTSSYSHHSTFSAILCNDLWYDLGRKDFIKYFFGFENLGHTVGQCLFGDDSSEDVSGHDYSAFEYDPESVSISIKHKSEIEIIVLDCLDECGIICKSGGIGLMGREGSVGSSKEVKSS